MWPGQQGESAKTFEQCDDEHHCILAFYYRAQIIRADAYYKIARFSTTLKHFSPSDFIGSK